MGFHTHVMERDAVEASGSLQPKIPKPHADEQWNTERFRYAGNTKT